MSKIGLYVYKIFLRTVDDYRPIPLSATGLGSELAQMLPTFIANRRSTNRNDQIERSWSLEPSVDVGFGRHGLVQYGTYGFSSTIRDPENRDVLFDRDSADVEEIPLYYQFWVPDQGNYGFAVLQSFRDRSCVSPVLGALNIEFSQQFDDVRLNIQKVMPIDDTAYQNASVRKLILSKRSVSRDRADTLRNILPVEVDVELSFGAKRRNRIGLFSDVAPAIRAAAGSAAFVFDGIEFDEASAVVRVGSGYKKIGIIGPANTAGVVDITDEVVLGDDLHPTFDSVSEVASQTIRDFREAYGLT